MIIKKYLYNYQTIVHFSSPVTSHFFSLRCMPCVNTCQQIVKRDMFLHPSDYLVYGADAWGNPLQYGRRADAHDAFIFVSSGEARLSPYCIPELTPGYVFRVESALTGLSDSMKAFLSDTGQKKNNELDFVLLLAENIHTYMCYSPGSTQIDTTAIEAFQQRKGVCQDYAHILIAMCRACGIPARYVNGFMQGVGVTHAWVEVLVNGEWRGIDPTNNRLIEYGYIKLAHGRDAMDCRVNRGVFTGNQDGTMAEQAAYTIIRDLQGADMVIDIHSSNIFLREIPQVRINVQTANKLVPYAKLFVYQGSLLARIHQF